MYFFVRPETKDGLSKLLTWSGVLAVADGLSTLAGFAFDQLTADNNKGISNDLISAGELAASVVSLALLAIVFGRVMYARKHNTENTAEVKKYDYPVNWSLIILFSIISSITGSSLLFESNRLQFGGTPNFSYNTAGVVLLAMSKLFAPTISSALRNHIVDAPAAAQPAAAPQPPVRDGRNGQEMQEIHKNAAYRAAV
ncbi:MAG: hypothetical protein COV52_07150 [Gammaproteobacteria bacterium CG11_big_fil_rev_8_21_14_0_20_46_22]|nr:MAG: hypothetical protein COW05_00165 [Gammaproteobacteria bacterium CG12_big_fil_rev_8_21_14_0_65_46_12]PIR10812.1 MAG: hypothetical protein COV52_07150 [Gammaproteobacteria bacterium CG11_big_fil_rev_8_21_14_0_20_46_22]